MAVLSVPKLGTELLKFLEPILDNPGLISGWKWNNKYECMT